MKAQVAIEYITIISIAFIILLPLILYVNDLLSDYNDDTRISLAKNTVKKLGENIDWVYAQGQPAKVSIQIYIPDGITEISLNNKTILFKIKTSAGISDIFYETVPFLNGSVPTTEGYYWVSLVSYENYVNISW
ncbi:MAG: hypothetical protein QXO27_03930 [Candidatus Aenigmatarchaeota archaeon]